MTDIIIQPHEQPSVDLVEPGITFHECFPVNNVNWMQSVYTSWKSYFFQEGDILYTAQTATLGCISDAAIRQALLTPEIDFDYRNSYPYRDSRDDEEDVPNTKWMYLGQSVLIKEVATSTSKFLKLLDIKNNTVVWVDALGMHNRMRKAFLKDELNKQYAKNSEKALMSSMIYNMLTGDAND